MKTPQNFTEVKEHGVQEVHPKVLSHGVHKVLDEKKEREKIHKGAEVHILQPDTPADVKKDEVVSVIKSKLPNVAIDQTRVKDMSPNKELTSTPQEKNRVKISTVEVTTSEEDYQQQPSKLQTEGAKTILNKMELKHGEVSTTSGVSKDPKPSPEHGPTETAQTKVETDGQVPFPTPHVVTGQTEITETPVAEKEKIHIQTVVHGLQLDIPTEYIPVIVKDPMLDAVQMKIQLEKVLKIKGETPADVHPKKDAGETTTLEVQNISSERQQTMAGRNCAQPLGVPEQDQFELSQTVTEGITNDKISKEVADDVPRDLDGQPVDKTEIHTTVHQAKTFTLEKEPRLESSIQCGTAADSKDETATAQIGQCKVEMSSVDVPESCSESLFEPKVQTDSHTPASKDKKEQYRKKCTAVEEDREKVVRAELKPPTATNAGGAAAEVRHQSMDLAQAVQKSSAVIVRDEGTSVEVMPTRESNVQLQQTPVQPGEAVMKVPKESGLGKIFKEVQPLALTEPRSPLTEGKPMTDAAETLITSTSDLENCVSRLLSKVLGYKSRRLELNPAAVSQQLEVVQECREDVRVQQSLLSQLSRTDAEKSNALELVKVRCSATIQEADGVIQSKRAQLEVVTAYCSQTQAVKTLLERLTAELDSFKMSPEESSSKEAERLSTLQRSVVQNRRLVEMMLTTHARVCPHLSWPERAAAQTQQSNLKETWACLERAVERTLYETNVRSHETNSLLISISSLQEDLKTVIKDLEAMSPSAPVWNCKKSYELMVFDAKIKAAKQKRLNLQQQSEMLLHGSRCDKEKKDVQRGLQTVQDQLCHAEGLVSANTQSSSNPIMEKMVKVMRDGLIWAKQAESDIEGRRARVSLLPEEVHRQLRDLKKLQSEFMVKQGQLMSLVEEVTELLPQLDQAEEVPLVRSSLKSLEDLSKSTTGKLAKAVREIESGLQTREKLSEQIADLESWVVAHLHKEASMCADDDLRSPAEIDRRGRQIQETLTEAERQSAVCQALLIKSKDIANDLSFTDNCHLFTKLTTLEKDIQAISIYEKANKKELDELNQTVDSSNITLASIDKSLQQILIELTRHRFPITRESLLALEPFKYKVLEHKSKVDLLQPWIPQEKIRDLYSDMFEIHSRLVSLESKCKDQEKYFYMRQSVEDLTENVQKQVHQTKVDSRELEKKYELCQTLIVQIPVIKFLSEETHYKLQVISPDLYPSELNTELRRLKENEESLGMLEMRLCDNISIIERDLLKDMDLNLEKESTQAFLLKTQDDVQKFPMMDPSDAAITNEYQRILCLQKTVASRMKALGVLLRKTRGGGGSQNLIDLKNAVLSECNSQMENISEARESLKSYTCTVRQAVLFLSGIEAAAMPPLGSAGLCSERLGEAQKALGLLQQQFQTHVEKLQSQVSLHPYLSPGKVEQLQEIILSRILVRMSSLQAKVHIQLEHLSRCAENHDKFTKCKEEILRSVRRAEDSLVQVLRQKVASLADCTDQRDNLRAVSEEVDSLPRLLAELKEWCTEQRCCGGREVDVTSLWKRVFRIIHCKRELTTRSKQTIAEWRQITDSVEKASAILEQVEAQFPQVSEVKASSEELHDLVHSWEQYQDGLDCEHRAVSALELRTARLLGVPAHLEQAPPTPLFKQLQAIQTRYDSVKQRSRKGLEAAKAELEEREKVREELHCVQIWLEAAENLLSGMEQSSSTEELQEVHSHLCTQKALLQHMKESLKGWYSGVDTVVPAEIEGQLQEVTLSLQHVEVKVGDVVERSGPVHRLGAKLSEIRAGLRTVQKRLEQRSPTVAQAEDTQKRVWDELDVWHSSLAALEVDLQDMEKPEEVLTLTERLAEEQQLYSQLAKQAEQRTASISKIYAWLQEHQEMISSSSCWMSEAESWLAAPCSYTTAKCLSSHVQALKTVLADSVQIRSTLQGFGSVLKEMSQVCNVTTLQEELLEADRRVSDVQESFTAPLSQLEHAATEVEAIESEVSLMERNVTEIKTLLASPETFSSPREESLKIVEQRIQSMRRTVAEIQKCKPGLCLPDKAEETLTVFSVVDRLQTLLLELEKKVPALFIQQPPTPVQTKAPALLQVRSSSSAEAENEDEQGQITVAHVEPDVLRRSGAMLMTVKPSSPEQRRTLTPDAQREHGGVLQAEGGAQAKGSEEQRVDEGGGGVVWWLWDAFMGAFPEEFLIVGSEEVTTSRSSSGPAGPEAQGSVSPGESGSGPGPRPGEDGQLELQLQNAQRSLDATGSPDRQDRVEQQLLTCQEMFLAIERNAAGLLLFRPVADQQPDKLGAVGSQQEAAELLGSKLDLLKANLVRFQQLLQDRQGGGPPLSRRHFGVTDSSLRRSDGTAGSVIGTQTLKELWTHISRLMDLGHMATEHLDQEELGRLEEFRMLLESLEGNLEVWQERLQGEARTADQHGLLDLSGLSADLELLNELSCSLMLGTGAALRLQHLNRCWADASARAKEACSELQTEALKRQNFQQKCESWMSFLQRMEDGLAVDVAGSYAGLRQQLGTLKRFQAELSTGHPSLHSVLTEALHLLQRGEVEDRNDFILKLAQLREHWQGVVLRADQRHLLVEGLVKHWHLYSCGLRKLQSFLVTTQGLLPAGGRARCSLQQLRRTLQNLQVRWAGMGGVTGSMGMLGSF
ncbi:nesprin-2-like [Brachionichthys hirsutus]|uniref:nesprin-2-like n=1 Tax=Brachionichthys hirsutus TaxID=412623 RepID=UPI003604EDD7